MFSDDLKKAMEEQNVSKRELAHYLYVRESTVQKWLNGDLPGIDNIYKIGELFDFDINEYAAEADRRKERRRYRIRTSFDGTKLRDEMYKRNVDTKKIAKVCGVTPCAVTNWCCNRNKPSTSSLILLNDFFNVTSEYWKEEKQGVFTPTEPVREEAKEVFQKAVNPHEVDKDKVKKNLEKLNNAGKVSVAEALSNLGKATRALIGEEPEEEKLDFSDTIMQENARLHRELDCAKSQIRYLEGVIEGMKAMNPSREAIKPIVTCSNGTGEEEKTEVKPNFWQKVFG